MQVFVPFPDVKLSVECLDAKRLGNQIYREALTLARGKWPNHPVALMWKYHTYFLCEYALAGLTELSYRGKYYTDTFDKFTDIMHSKRDTGPPSWWGDERVHSSHRSALLYKDPSHYGQFGWKESPKMDYYYPPFNNLAELKRINNG